MSELVEVSAKDQANYWLVTVDNFNKESLQKLGIYAVDGTDDRFHGGSFRGVKEGDIFILHNLLGKGKLKGVDVGIARASGNPYYDPTIIPGLRDAERPMSRYNDEYPWRVEIDLLDEDVFESPVKSQEWLNEMRNLGTRLDAVKTYRSGTLYRGRTIMPLTDEEAAIILMVLGRRNRSALKYI